MYANSQQQRRNIITDRFHYMTGRDYKEINCPMERSDLEFCYIMAIN